jgi:hypothetical protein
MLIILTIIAITLAIGLGCITFKIRNNKISTPMIEKYVVQGKRYGADEYLLNFITPTNPEVQNFVLKNSLNTGTQLEKIAKCYNIIEEHYTYTLDNNARYENDGIILYGNGDLWLYPHEVLAMKKQTGGVNIDCEDGAFVIESLMLEAEVGDVFACLGTVTLYDPETGKATGTYGHGWMIVKYNGQWCLLEGTYGKILVALIPIDTLKYIKYNAQFTFNDKNVDATIGADLNKTIEQPPLPPSQHDLMIKLLQLSGY